MATLNSNMIIGFDTLNAQVKVMTVQGTSLDSARIDYYRFDRKLMDKGDYVSIISTVFESYDEAKLQMSNISIVLPNSLVCHDFVGIPTMKKKQMAEAVIVEFNALYKNHDSLLMVPTPINATKKNALYILLITNKAMLDGMTNIFTAKKLVVKTRTYESNAAVNAVLQLRPKMRRASFIYVDIREDNTLFAVVNKERTVGFQNLPFGYNILSRTEVNVESMWFDHDVAELAVINATELARKKKLTVDAAEADAEEEAAKEAEEQARREAEEAAAKAAEEAAEQSASSSDFDDLDGSNNSSSSEKAEGGEETETVAEERKPAVKVFAKKAPKALPMFMQRPTPETEEGFIAENFRIFEKRILLLKRHCDYDSIMPNPEFILINMPNEYEFMIEMLNNDEDNGIEFRYFSPETENAPLATENLDLIGALYAGTWNKQNNF